MNFAKDEAGNPKVSEEEIFRLLPEIRRYLAAFGMSKEGLEDAVQETIIRAWMNVNKLRDISCLKQWVMKIARNVGKAHVKKERRRIIWESSLEDKMERMERVASGGDEENPGEELCVLMENPQTEQIAELLNRISERERKVIVLQYGYKFSLKEIAEMIGETYVNTRTISSRAMNKLKTYAGQKKEEED